MNNQPSSVVLFKRYVVNAVITGLMDDYNEVVKERDEACNLLKSVGIIKCKYCKNFEKSNRLKVCKVCDGEFCSSCAPLKRFYPRIHVCRICQLKCIKEYGYCTICYNFKLSDGCNNCIHTSGIDIPSEDTEEDSLEISE